jgi:glycosyltransferase involved in cell wall biosynthesis
VSTLTEELVRRGHDVTLFASGDSVTSARLVPIVDQALWHHPDWQDLAPFVPLALGKVLQEADSFDLIHNHLDYPVFPLARAVPGPVLTTLHGRLDLPELQPLYTEFCELPLVSISAAQREPLPHCNWVATIHHGIDLEEFPFNPRPGSYLAVLGRIAPEKGIDTAIRVARRAGIPIKIAAREPLPLDGDPNARRDREYYEQVLQPLLREPGVDFVGEVGGTAKAQFLGEALALLFPIRWPEPFGLVMIEALASGTPVVALRAGSVPEVIEHGSTGLIATCEDGLVDAVRRLDVIDRASCRATAERRFSAAAMADQYERLYAELIGCGSSPIIPLRRAA